MSFPRKLLSLLLVLLLLPAAALATSTGAVQNTRTGQTYQSLKDAVDGASTGDTLELLADVSLSAPLTIGTRVRVESNDKMVSGIWQA